MASFDLSSRVALVTGGARGLGRAMAAALAAHGATVLINGRSQAALDEAARSVGGHSAVADITDAASRDALFARIEAEHGGLDILINNAGARARRPLEDFAPGDLERVTEGNVFAPFELCRLAAPMMRARGRDSARGRIINIASIAGPIARGGDAAYTAAKAGLIGLTRALAAELGSGGITVNAIAPGFFATESNTQMVEDPAIGAWLKTRTSLGRWGRADEIGGAAVFLASDAASFVTGHVLVVDGGHVSHF
ncbi:MAG: SDR family oxidoreductase [Paracoccaceae bacterium]|nr:SDR family oxidoreductase [Paracoccaceae bacterium]